jgi:hypothetical protein
MADKPVAVDKCRRCGYGYGRLRPMCQGAECIAYRNLRNPGADGSYVLTGLCIQCCFRHHYPFVKKTLQAFPETNTFLCINCIGEFNLVHKCTCCALTPLCGGCCAGYEHTKCCVHKITLVNHALRFVHPAPTSEFCPNGVQWLEREDSLKILDKTAPASWLDPKGFKHNASRRYAAVEIEIFNYEDSSILAEALAKWNCSVVHDGSILREHVARLRPKVAIPDMTFEINTSPACGDALRTQLSDIGLGLEKAKANVTQSCGIHVHVDCRDYGYQEIHKLLKVYACIEDALFASVHWSRYNNDFCKPCGEYYHDKFIKGIKPDTKSLKPALIKSLYGKQALDLAPSRYDVRSNAPAFWNSRTDHYGRTNPNNFGRRNELRYSALNLHSYFLRGTVESRIHHGSNDFNEIYNWAKLHVDLFDAIFRIPQGMLDKLLQISELEVEGARELIDIDKIIRPFTKDKLATGVVILRALLPDETFSIYLDKLRINCHDEEVSTQDLLPCQKGKELPANIRMPKKPSVPAPQPEQIIPVQAAVPRRVRVRQHIDPVPRLRRRIRDNDDD